jgi:hypothetical protein
MSKLLRASSRAQGRERAQFRGMMPAGTEPHSSQGSNQSFRPVRCTRHRPGVDGLP